MSECGTPPAELAEAARAALADVDDVLGPTARAALASWLEDWPDVHAIAGESWEAGWIAGSLAVTEPGRVYALLREPGILVGVYRCQDVAVRALEGRVAGRPELRPRYSIEDWTVIP